MGPTHAAYQQHLIDHGVFFEVHHGEGYEGLANQEEVKHRLLQRRPSLSPDSFSDEAFVAFIAANYNASSEATVMSMVIPMISGNASLPSLQNIQFKDLEDLTDGSIKKATPDLYDGARPESVH
ncbi:MAG: hypothetical protein Q9163_005583 [Psora crenata]